VHTGGVAAALAALLLLSPLQMIAPPALHTQPVQAKELASGRGSKVNKDPLSLLRLGLPGQPKEVRDLQAALESCQDNLSRLLFSKASGDLSNARGIISGKSAAILKKVPATDVKEGEKLIASMASGTEKLSQLISSGKVSDETTEVQTAVLADLSKLEGLIAAPTPPVTVPAEFNNLPQLKKRAIVEFVAKKGPEAEFSSFNVDGNLFKTAVLRMEIDGYTAPVTAGNFVDLVNKGFYDGMRIQRSDGFVVQTGDPSKEGRGDGKTVGYVPEGKEKVRNVPLEVFVKNDMAPIYGSTFDDDGRGGYASALPFNAYGALGMAREEYDSDSGSSQFFWLLFDSDLTPAGKNLLDGRYSCFGYTIEGARFLSDLKEGDIIQSAKVVQGLDNLVPPKE
jgi:cyclophilin family peptidyl-prolyl cis-trans isomerase